MRQGGRGCAVLLAFVGHALQCGLEFGMSAGPTTWPVIIDGSRIGDCGSSCAGAACSTCAWVASSCGCACAEPKSQTQTHTQSIILDSNPGLLGMSQASAKPEPALPQLASDVVMSDPGLDEENRERPGNRQSRQSINYNL